MAIFTAEAIKPQLKSWPLLHFYYSYTLNLYELSSPHYCVRSVMYLLLACAMSMHLKVN